MKRFPKLPDFQSVMSRCGWRYALVWTLITATGCNSLTGATNSLNDVTVLELEERPNILLILVDDMDLLLGTPETMSKLKSELIDQGLTIDQFFITTPVCCPARATFLRGQFTHNHKVFTNEGLAGGFTKFFEQGHESSTVGTWLQTAGYHTAFLGKYLNGFPLPQAREYIPPGWTEWYVPVKGRPYTGFGYTLNENGSFVDYGERPEDYLTDVLTQKTLGVIEAAETSEQPFFIFLSYYAPHEPSTPAPRHAEMFLEAEAPRTPNFNEEDVSDKPHGIRSDPLLDAVQIAEIDHRYRLRLQSMQAVDEAIPQLIGALRESGQLENTYIIFTSDNGFHMGQHRLLWGKTQPYEEDIRVPFIIRGPGIPNGEVLTGYLGSNVDFAPTVAELAGLIPPDYVDGQSLVPLFLPDRRPAIDAWRGAVLIEFYGNKSDESGDLPPSYLGLRTSQYMYIEHEDGFVELYELLSDPFELSNLADEAAPDLLRQFADWVSRLSSCSGSGCAQIENSIPALP
ncbi:MAG: sulfatase family protein [Anaerolineales bacterium]